MSTEQQPPPPATAPKAEPNALAASLNTGWEQFKQGKLISYPMMALILVIVGLVNRNQWLVSGTRALFYGEDQSVAGSEVRVPMADDGHYWVRATINGVERRMLVDSGASITALSTATAGAAKIATDSLSPPIEVDTANGQVVAKSGKIATLQVGGITATDLGVVVAPEFGETDALGMNFLSKLKSWRVEGKVLILTPASK